MLTYDDSVSQVIFVLMEGLMLQSAADDGARQEGRRSAWECLRLWSGKLDRSVHGMGNLAFDLGVDAETFWRQHDMVVLIARIKAREADFRRWFGPE